MENEDNPLLGCAVVMMGHLSVLIVAQETAEGNL